MAFGHQDLDTVQQFMPYTILEVASQHTIPTTRTSSTADGHISDVHYWPHQVDRVLCMLGLDMETVLAQKSQDNAAPVTSDGSISFLRSGVCLFLQCLVVDLCITFSYPGCLFILIMGCLHSPSVFLDASFHCLKR